MGSFKINSLIIRYLVLTGSSIDANLKKDMNYYGVLAGVACVTYIYLAILVLAYKKITTTHKSFAGLCVVLALWSLGCVGQQLGNGTPWAPLFDRIYYTGSELFILAGIIFAISLTSSWKSRFFRILLIGVAVRMSIYQTVNWGWNLLSRDFPNGFWFISHQLICILESLFIPLIVAMWGGMSKLHRERVQAKIVLFSTVIGTLIGVAVDFVSGAKGYSPISCTIPLLWMIAIIFAILRYGLMQHYPAQVSRELIEHIDQAVFMVDSSWNITDFNNAAMLLIALRRRMKTIIPMEDVFIDLLSIKNQIEAVSVSETSNYSRISLIRTFSGDSILIKVNFSIINDQWGDRIGILALCHPHVDLQTFISDYKLSDRQADILRHIISGRSQAQTAEALFVTLATVKTHTTNLYNRLGISNRGELFALLQDKCSKMTSG